MEFDVAEDGTIRRHNITYLPVVPGRIEFSAQVRNYLLEHRPEVVGVELPALLEAQYSRAVERMPQMSVIVIPDSSNYETESAAYIPVEPGDPFIEALRTAREINAKVLFLDPAAGEQSHVASSYPDPYAVELIGVGQYVEAYLTSSPTGIQPIGKLADSMAWKLQGADPLAGTCVVVSLNVLRPLLDAMEIPQEEPAPPKARLFEAAELFNLHPDCLAEVTTEAPYYQELYENGRKAEPGTFRLERLKWQLALFRDAEKEYVINTGDQIVSWQRRTLAKFTRNLALVNNSLIPALYDLAIGARAIIDDNYAYEVWQMGNRYSVQQTEDDSIETLNISGAEVWLHTRKIRIRRRLPRVKQMLRPAALKKRKREKVKGEWAAQTNGANICSYPPEDIVIENYGKFLKRYAKTLLSEERARVEPFTTSLLDGIDLRETIRNWYRGKLYVSDRGKSAGEVGGLVIIFDEDRENRYGYLTTWLGEHQNESDMAFYSTQPFDHLVGPGIGRAEYGGLLMTLPPRRLFDVWRDPDYDLSETKAERLLMAALDYSIERHVVYIAAKPPRTIFRQMAARLNRKIVYVPIGQLSPSKLKKIRVVHVLDSYSRREEAQQYIW